MLPFLHGDERPDLYCTAVVGLVGWLVGWLVGGGFGRLGGKFNLAEKVLYAWSELGLVGSWHGDDDRAGEEDEICSSRSPPLWPRCKGIKQEEEVGVSCGLPLAMQCGGVSSHTAIPT